MIIAMISPDGKTTVKVQPQNVKTMQNRGWTKTNAPAAKPKPKPESK